MDKSNVISVALIVIVLALSIGSIAVSVYGLYCLFLGSIILFAVGLLFPPFAWFVGLLELLGTDIVNKLVEFIF